MNVASMVLQTVLALTALISAGFGMIFWRQTRAQKEAETDKTEIEATEIANKAAAINESREREREEWWQRQFGELRGEFESERALSLRRFRRLNTLEGYLDVLMRYLRMIVNRLRKYESDIEEPPQPPDGDGVI